jgi:hypothetical protein
VEINLKDKIYTCIGCGLNDPLVECAGIYYCPNPFCSASGSTNWKTENLNVEKDGDGYKIVSYEGWLEKGMAVINAMQYPLGAKIMALKKTKDIIKMLKRKEL